MLPSFEFLRYEEKQWEINRSIKRLLGCFVEDRIDNRWQVKMTYRLKIYEYF